MKSFVRITRALSDPTRVRALMLLRGGELCLCQLIEVLGLAPSTVSKHLSVLKAAGIIRDDKRGSSVFYTLKMPCVLSFFKCVESVMRNSAEEQLKLTK